MRQLPKVAVVGAGYFGRFHARHYAANPDCELAAVVDADGERARAVAAEFGGRALDRLDDLPGDVVAATVASPTSTHGAVAEALIARGIHLLVEKPLAATAAQADRLVAAADAAGLVLAVGHVERFSAAYGALAATLPAPPAFIEARRMTEPRRRATDVDVVLDLMIHDIDLALDLAGAPVADVEAVGAAYVNPTLDVCQARLAFENGVVAHLTASRIAESGERTLRVHHGAGFTVADLAGLALSDVAAGPAGAAAEPDWRLTRRQVERQDALGAEIADFLSAVAGERAPRVPGHAGRDALAVALRVSALASNHEAGARLVRSA